MVLSFFAGGFFVFVLIGFPLLSSPLPMELPSVTETGTIFGSESKSLENTGKIAMPLATRAAPC
ncbi:MAG: hypothetical protein ACR2NP_08470 [Pirellulaceae bacterium]